jgi:multiple sugar transport system substrate-binding protein
MKKRFVLLLVFSAMMISLTFAAGTTETAGATAEPIVTVNAVGTPGAPIQIRGLIGAWNTMSNSNQTVQAYYQDRMMTWAKNHPDVYLEIEVIPGGQTAQAMTKLLTAAAAGNPQDFANIDSQWVGNFHEAGVLKPIDDFFTDEVQAQFFDFTKGVTYRNGKQYALWAEAAPLFFYYNKQLVDTVPQTWDELIDAAKKIQTTNPSVTPFMISGKGAAAAHCILPFFFGQGGMLFDENDNYRPVFGEGENRTALIKAFNFYKQMVDEKIMPAEILGYEHNDILAEAKAGKVAMMVAGSWINGGLDQDIWGYTSIPMVKIGQGSNVPGGWTFAFLSKDKKKLEAAVSFIREVYIDPEPMSLRTRAQGYIPTRADVFETPEFNTPFYQAIAHEFTIGQSRPATSLYPDIETLLQESIGKLVSGSSDAVTLVDNMQKKMNDKYLDRL